MGASAAKAPAEARRAPARRGQGGALREDILAAASAMIARSGDAATLTLRAVAREVGVAATSIYLHFDSVEALLVAVKSRRFAELGEVLRAAADGAGADPVARVRARAHAYVRFGADHPGEYAVMFASRLLFPDAAVVRPAEALQVFDALTADLAAVPGHDLAGPPQAQMLAFHLWTAMHGMVQLRTLRPHMPWPAPAVQVDDLVDRLLG